MDFDNALNEYRENERRGTLPETPEFESVYQTIIEHNEIEQRLAKIETIAGRQLTDDERHRIRMQLAEDGSVMDGELLDKLKEVL